MTGGLHLLSMLVTVAPYLTNKAALSTWLLQAAVSLQQCWQILSCGAPTVHKLCIAATVIYCCHLCDQAKPEGNAGFSICRLHSSLGAIFLRA